MRPIVASAFVFSLAVTSAALACDGQTSAAAKPKVISVDELASVIAQKTTVAIYDANNADTRKKYGVIPGAHLLSHYDSFDVQKELPQDKAARLVFYCGGEKCSAAPKAAARAIDAGYTNVSVLSAGITGWATAGKATNQPQA